MTVVWGGKNGNLLNILNTGQDGRNCEVQYICRHRCDTKVQGNEVGKLPMQSNTETAGMSGARQMKSRRS